MWYDRDSWYPYEEMTKWLQLELINERMEKLNYESKGDKYKKAYFFTTEEDAMKFLLRWK
jgi:hypothetical protein